MDENLQFIRNFVNFTNGFHTDTVHSNRLSMFYIICTFSTIRISMADRFFSQFFSNFFFNSQNYMNVKKRLPVRSSCQKCQMGFCGNSPTTMIFLWISQTKRSISKFVAVFFSTHKIYFQHLKIKHKLHLHTRPSDRGRNINFVKYLK
jgi:hypothetical protein